MIMAFFFVFSTINIYDTVLNTIRVPQLLWKCPNWPLPLFDWFCLRELVIWRVQRISASENNSPFCTRNHETVDNNNGWNSMKWKVLLCDRSLEENFICLGWIHLSRISLFTYDIEKHKFRLISGVRLSVFHFCKKHGFYHHNFWSGIQTRPVVTKTWSYTSRCKKVTDHISVSFLILYFQLNLPNIAIDFGWDYLPDIFNFFHYLTNSGGQKFLKFFKVLKFLKFLKIF